MREQPLRLSIACLGIAIACAAQNPPATTPQTPQNQQGDIIIRERVDRVPVLFTASDHRNRFINDLARSDVQVFDNKKKQEIVEFTKETDLHLRVGLMIDTSNSIRDRFKFEQEAAIEFLRSMVRTGKDQVFLMSYDTNVEMVQDFTDDIDKLTRGIR